jgi:shikimate dehydrogenase
VANRSPQRAQALVSSVAAPTLLADTCPLESLGLRDALARADLLVNATPAGMWPATYATPLPAGALIHPGLTVMDLIPNPLETLLLHQAHQAGAKVIHGMDMLIHQGAIAFRLWTGQEAPMDLMRQVALAVLEQRTHL